VGNRREYIKNNNIKINYTTLFLLPIFRIGGKKNTPQCLIGAYLTKNDKQLAICFDKDWSKCKDTVLDLECNKHFDHEEINDDEIILFMNISKKYEVDINLFKIGRWSKLSNDLKSLIVETHTRMMGNGKYLTMADAVFPDKSSKEYRAEELGIKITDLPGGEVISIPDMENERFKTLEELYDKAR